MKTSSPRKQKTSQDTQVQRRETGGLSLDFRGTIQKHRTQQHAANTSLQMMRLQSLQRSAATSTSPIIQRVVNWGEVDRTAGDNYAVSGDNATLYSKMDAAAPALQGLYIQASDVTNAEVPENLRTWRPNVKFLSGNVIDRGGIPAPPLQEGQVQVPLPSVAEILQGLQPQYNNIKGQVRDAMNRVAGEGEVSPTMGIVGRNDCGQWARALQGLISTANEGAEAAEDFDLGYGEAANLDNAPAPLQVGDEADHQLGEGAGSGHHGATVVATDGTSIVTLEAHVEQNLEAPAFHIYEGLPGFIDANNAGDEPNQYLENNGRTGTVRRVADAYTNKENRRQMLEHYTQGLQSEDNGERLSSIEGALRYYENVVNAPIEVEPEVEQIQEIEHIAVPEPRSNRCCFLTTACTQARGLPDDCEELSVLRHFRDTFLQNLSTGPGMIDRYYLVAPLLVEQIEQNPRRKQIYEEIYAIIRRCVDAIQLQHHAYALKLYKDMVERLQLDMMVDLKD